MTTVPRKPPLRVLLSFERAQASGDPYAFRFEPQDYTLPTVGGGSPSARFDWTTAVLADLKAIREPGREPVVLQRMGERLRTFVVQARGKDWDSQITEAIDAKRPVLLSIRSSAAELYALPWELLTLSSGQFVGEVDGLLLRFEWPDAEAAQEEPCPRAEGGRILVAWSGAVPASEHIEAIRSACAAGFHPFDVEADVLPRASLAGIVQKLKAAQESNRPISVLHLLCHGAATGSTFGLALDGDREPVVVDATQIRQQLAPFSRMVRLVVLSACDSGNAGELANEIGSVAQTLHRNRFQSVVASRFPLSVSGSITLTKCLYETLLSGPDSLETAFLAARQQLTLRDSGVPDAHRSLDWASLQLYACQSAGEDTRPIVFRPFRGLLAFRREHSRFFFGREHELTEILSDLQALLASHRPRLLVVTGASGTGKSSLVLAAAVPALLRQDPCLVFRCIRPGNAPLVALEEAMRGMKGHPGILVVDQLEELFTVTADHGLREAFIRELWRLAADPQGELRVLLTLRVDFLGRCGDLVLDPASGLRFDRVAVDPAHQVHIPQMNKTQLKAAICEPVRRVGLELQEGLDTRLVDDVGGEPGALPLMEDALDALWQRRVGRLLTQAAYDQLGASTTNSSVVLNDESGTNADPKGKQSGVVGALRMRADDLLSRIERAHPDDMAVARRLLVSLVGVTEDTALDTRRRVALASLKSICCDSEASAASFDRVLPQLVAARLLVQDDDQRTPHVEVAHEALIRTWSRLRRWLEEDRVTLLAQRRLTQAAQEWELKGRDSALLYRGTQLAPDADWRKDWRPEATEREFIAASEAQRTREERARLRQLRRTRLAAVVFGILFVTAAGAGWLAYGSAREAKEKGEQLRRKATESVDRMLVANAQERKEDPAAMAALLREVQGADFALWTQSAIDALQGSAADIVLRGHEAPVKSVAFSPDGKQVVTGSEDGTARIWSADHVADPLLLNQNRQCGVRAAITAIAFIESGARVITGSDAGQVCSWHADGSQASVLGQHGKGIQAIAVSPDGKTFVTGSKETAGARIWDADGGSTASPIDGKSGPIRAIAFSPDGKRIVAASEYGMAFVWNRDGSGTPIPISVRKEILSVAFSPDGQSIAMGSDGHLGIWNGPGFGNAVDLDRSSAWWVRFTRDGNKLVVGDQSTRSIRGWALDKLEPYVAETMHVPTADLRVTAASPDGTRLVTGSTENTARIWNLGASALPKRLRIDQFYSKLVTASADGTRVVSVFDKSATVWNAGVGTPLHGHTELISSVAFRLDGTRVGTGSRDTTVRVWDVSLPSGRRSALLGESRLEAERRHAYCRHEVARRRGWPTPQKEP